MLKLRNCIGAPSRFVSTPSARSTQAPWRASCISPMPWESKAKASQAIYSVGVLWRSDRGVRASRRGRCTAGMTSSLSTRTSSGTPRMGGGTITEAGRGSRGNRGVPQLRPNPTLGMEIIRGQEPGGSRLLTATLPPGTRGSIPSMKLFRTNTVCRKRRVGEG